MPQIHPTAVVDPNARLAADVTVGPHCVVSGDVEIGAGTVLASGVVVEGPTMIGKDCRLAHHAVVGSVPQDLKYKGARSLVEIGDSNTIREFVTINRATDEGDRTVVGNNNLLMAYVHLAHNCVIGNNVILANAVNLAGHVTIDDFASIGGLTPVHQFVRIGKYAFIGGGSRVPKDVCPFVRAAGNPLRIAGLNSVGLMRRGFSQETRLELKRLYRLFFRSGLNTSQALARIQDELPGTPEVNEFVRFVRASQRGVERGVEGAEEADED
ncbi:MAG: acyl-ACP--UDP-N-acetylglucosamine O-acyltransferase [Candidatus Eisenbacteria bacterium]|nr:acyl-ACP--UDP-N-acetylglucosamine O-acyltransferase [Candidatus Eisenbacteria bacterium]